MTVTAVIPTYERHDLLVNRALASVLRQTVPVDEIIIVADGESQESFYELVVSIEWDSRGHIVNIPRQAYPDDPGQRWCVLGLDARNTGLDRATGDYIAPLDDDDEWSPDHVAILLDAINATGADFAYGMSEYHWPDRRPQQAGSWPPGMGAFCDGSQMYRNGMGYRYDPECIARGLPEDGDLWTRMYEAGVQFTFVPRVVHHYWPNPR